MIIKSHELKKINLNLNNFVLFYGKNEGLKNDATKFLIKEENKLLKFDEKEILSNTDQFFEIILSNSLFEKRKNILVKRSTDKIFKIIEELNKKKLDNTLIILNSENLDKKSKLRSFFEKNKDYICVPFYPDNEQTLIKIALNFLEEKQISLSKSDINLIVNKCNGDREILTNELKKIELYCLGGKKIESENIARLTNLIDNHSISLLIDNCLAKNKKKIINILNENNFSNEDCIIIVRTFLNKSKKIDKLILEFKKNKNIDLTISSSKPPIFWKDKEITKQQITKWSPRHIKELIYSLNQLELTIKKNLANSINIITDFIIEKSAAKTNN